MLCRKCGRELRPYGSKAVDYPGTLHAYSPNLALCVVHGREERKPKATRETTKAWGSARGRERGAATVPHELSREERIALVRVEIRLAGEERERVASMLGLVSL